jgi:UDPglucose 6-dehydrogenase
MRIGIAGYGTVGQFVGSLFQDHHEVVVADPPKGIGALHDLNEADFVFVCVPTPSLPDGGCDTRHVEAVVAQVRPRRALICHSTVAIGTTDRLIEAYGVPLVYVPQYAGESPDHYYRQRDNLDFLIIGGYEPAASSVSALFRPVLGERTRHAIVEPRVAETVKYMENAFLAMKVAFCNEFHDLAAAAGVDYEQVRRLWLLDHRINPSHTTVTAERGYGGACLPKDVDAVCATATAVGAPLEILETVQRVNARRRRAAAARSAAPVGVAAG